MNNYYFTFGTNPDFPYQKGYVIIKADSWDEAFEKWDTRFGNKARVGRNSDVINCAFFYDEANFDFNYVSPNYPSEICHEIIE